LELKKNDNIDKEIKKAHSEYVKSAKVLIACFKKHCKSNIIPPELQKLVLFADTKTTKNGRSKTMRVKRISILKRIKLEIKSFDYDKHMKCIKNDCFLANKLLFNAHKKTLISSINSSLLMITLLIQD
jgi:hypothetical protein